MKMTTRRGAFRDILNSDIEGLYIDNALVLRFTTENKRAVFESRLNNQLERIKADPFAATINPNKLHEYKLAVAVSVYINTEPQALRFLGR